VYGAADDPKEVERVASYCRAAHLKNRLNQATLGALGGRGMGQTCGVADPSQWMRVFGVDIDSRDTTALLRRAQSLPEKELEELQPRLAKLFGAPPPKSLANERSMRLYLALKALVQEEGWDFYTIQSFPGLGDDYSATCFAQSIMLWAISRSSTVWRSRCASGDIRRRHVRSSSSSSRRTKMRIATTRSSAGVRKRMTAGIMTARARPRRPARALFRGARRR